MIKQKLFCAFLFCCLACIFNSCQKESFRGSNSKDNKSPVANAGSDTTIMLPLDSFTLDGSNSTDPDGRIVKYSWSNISAPFLVLIDNPQSVVTKILARVNGLYEFELQVTDDGGLTARDTIRITLNLPDKTEMCEDRPVINARLVPIATLSKGRMGLKAAAAGGQILFAGGFGGTEGPSTRVDIYDIASNRLSTAELSKVSNAARYDFSVTSCGNKILFAGGLLSLYDIDDSQTSIVDIYDTSLGTWSVANLSFARYNIGAASSGDIAVFAGGTWVINYPEYSWGSSDVVDIYDNRTNSWSTATLSESRGKISATAAGNKIYFAGGARTLNPASFPSLSNTIDVFDVISGSWSTATSLNEAKEGMASIAAGNKIFWGGGIASGGTGSSEVEIRDLNTGNSSFACMFPRSNFTAVIKNDNIVFFTGEHFPTDGVHFDIYNITSDTWYTGVLDQYIANAAIIAVNNTIYVAGGIDGNGKILDKVWRLEF